ncbi:hypothetical protein BJP50_16115 [Paenibacillus odorifer]|nr:hypothetical protein BJP50_16115 [Paenibacillus odorifer]
MSSIDNKLALYGGQSTIQNKLKYEWPKIAPEDNAYISEVLNRGEISYNVQTDEIDKLEENFREYLQVPYCLALNSGTSALFLAFLALGLKAGDEVIAPTYTYPASIMPLLHLGVKPVFVDSGANSPLTTVELIEQKVTDKTKAIIVSHMDGYAANLIGIEKLATKYNCYIIEDCAQSLGASYKGKLTGTVGDMSIFSLQQKKLVTGGEGGILVTKNKTLYEKCILLSYLVIRSEKDVTDSELRPYFSTGLGFNFRIHPLAAALANTQFPKMEQNLSSRRRVLLKLSNKMKELKSIKMPEIEGDIVESSFYSFKVLYCPSTVGNLPISIFIEALNAEGVPIFKSITRPLHIEYIFKKDNREFLLRNFQSDAFIIDESDEYPNSEDYFNRALRLPPYFEISDSDIDLIINAFKKVENNIDQLKKRMEK